MSVAAKEKKTGRRCGSVAPGAGVRCAERESLWYITLPYLPYVKTRGRNEDGKLPEFRDTRTESSELYIFLIIL